MQRNVAAEEIERQLEISDRLAERLGGNTYHIVTYGCQMNAHESDVFAGKLERMGLTSCDKREEADVLLFNTCCVRENAEKRLYANVAKLSGIKRKRPGMLIGVCGCVMQQPGFSKKFMEKFPFIDFITGTQGTYRLPEIILNALDGRVDAVAQDTLIAEGEPVKRAHPAKASITIMYGCENFCTYCVVPSVRGIERSRDAAMVIAEAQRLADDGVKEILLLGQNVNSYNGGMSFANLLKNLNGVVPRIRFMTSHPKDCSDELLKVMASCKSVQKQLHLPVQSGSDRILENMNRRYTAHEYLSLVERARDAMPNVGLTSDIIVGFPGETENDFEDTLKLFSQAHFDAAYTFAYSRRPGTPAAQMDGQVPESVKNERLRRLIGLKESVAEENMRALIGSEDELLVEGPSRKGDGVCGRTGRGIMLNVAENAEIGEIHRVIYTGVNRNTARGEFAK